MGHESLWWVLLLSVSVSLLWILSMSASSLWVLSVSASSLWVVSQSNYSSIHWKHGQLAIFPEALIFIGMEFFKTVPSNKIVNITAKRMTACGMAAMGCYWGATHFMFGCVCL